MPGGICRRSGIPIGSRPGPIGSSCAPATPKRAANDVIAETFGCSPELGEGVPDATSRIATQDQLDGAFRRLSVEHRTIVVLVHYLGLSPTEAAERMGTPAGTARSRLHYALQQLRSAIEADARALPARGTA